MDTDKKTYSGYEFNKLYKDIQMVKLTNIDEKHNGLKYNTGINEDFRQFNPVSGCHPGGLYFCSINNFYLWINYSASPMVYIRKVTIPDDALVYVDDTKFKANKFILGERKIIYSDKLLYKLAIKAYPLGLQFVPEAQQTNEMCKLAVCHDGNALQFVINQTNEIYDLAVRQNPTAAIFSRKNMDKITEKYKNSVLKNPCDIMSLEVQPEKLCILLVQQTGYALEFIKYQTEKICIEAVKQSGIALKYVKIKTDEICRLAVSENGHALMYVENQTDELCRLAVKTNGCAIKYIIEQTNELCKLAIQQDGDAILYIKNQTEELCKLAVQRNWFSIRFVKKEFQTEEICKISISQQPWALSYIENQTEEICKYAVMLDITTIKYIKTQNL